jgi:preprotein translocase subunit YajC
VDSPLIQGLLGLLVFPLVLWFFYSRSQRAAMTEPTEETVTS